MAEATQLQMLGTVGGAATTGDGATAVVRLGADRSQAVTQSYSRYMDRVLKGSVYIGSNLLGTPVTTQAGLSATTPALTIYNPAGSGVNAFLLGVQITFTAAPAAASGACLAYNLTSAAAPTSVTAANVINAQMGSTAAGKVACYRIATLAAAPVAGLFLGGTTGAAAISGFNLFVPLDGLVAVVPGCAVSVQTTSAAAILASFIWDEVPTSIG